MSAVTSKPIRPQMNRLVPVSVMPLAVPTSPQPIVNWLAIARPTIDRRPVTMRPL
ncbi:hypothetical protein D3C84_1275410 [compost metagenome]